MDVTESVLVRVDTGGRIAEVILNRSQRLNALTEAMEQRLFAELRRLAADPDISCIVVRGNGEAFSAGYDIEEHIGAKGQEVPLPGSALEDWVSFRDLLARWVSVRELPIPTIAAIHGYCFGIATVFASLVDLVVIAEDAVWGAAQLRGGGGSSGPVLASLIGQRKAREIEFRAARLSGVDAVNIGWANYAVPCEEVERYARELALDIARTPREALIAKKAAFNRMMDAQGFAASIEDAALVHTILNYSDPVQALRKRVASDGFKGVTDAR